MEQKSWQAAKWETCNQKFLQTVRRHLCYVHTYIYIYVCVYVWHSTTRQNKTDSHTQVYGNTCMYACGHCTYASLCVSMSAPRDDNKTYHQKQSHTHTHIHTYSLTLRLSLHRARKHWKGGRGKWRKLTVQHWKKSDQCRLVQLLLDNRF